MSRAERTISILTLLTVALFTLYDRGGEWRGEWNWSITYAMGTTVLTGPVVAAIAAWLGWNRHGLRAATDSAPQGWLVALRHGAAAWLLGLTALVAATAVAIGATLLVPHGGPIDPLSFAEAPFLLAAYAALGAVAGFLVPHPVTAVLMAPLTFLAAMVGSEHVSVDFLRATIESTGSPAGTRLSPLSVCGAIAGLAGLAAVSISLGFGRGPRRVATAAVAAGVGLLLVSELISHTHGTDAWEPSDESATSCAGTAPVVCVMPSHVGALSALAPEVDRLAPYLGRAGATVPARFEESLWRVGDPSVGAFYLEDGARTHADAEQAADVLTMPSDCPAYSSDDGPPYAAFTARHLIASWLVRQAGESIPAQSTHEDAWLRSSPSAQRAWVARTYAQLAACDLRALRAPWPKSRT